MIIELLKIIKILVNLSIRYNVEKYIIKRRRRRTTSATDLFTTSARRTLRLSSKCKMWFRPKKI